MTMSAEGETTLELWLKVYRGKALNEWNLVESLSSPLQLKPVKRCQRYKPQMDTVGLRHLIVQRILAPTP